MTSFRTPDPMFTSGKRVRPDQRSNFTAGRHLSYSYCSPFSTAPGFHLNSDKLSADFATVADKNPGTTGGSDVTTLPHDAPPSQLAKANSRNHRQAGQNVLYGDGHVQFWPTPYCGVGSGRARDNIFTAASRTPLPASTESPISSTALPRS